ncbi:putative sterigmatocystin biosynthesis monooxygenase [Lachnellula suecica]|uniref:Putative sterigmatocystin biosynthesis monooxygenase n=1 Tax=Lachnellula suecica TaxID=602035 RepID=A0A8T9CI98_9HELO|nr:putative sterigmatocystin biosynthesis monooxygenase [Lachnellula suecica]
MAPSAVADPPPPANSHDGGYQLLAEPLHKKRKMRLLCIGAGIAGIAAAYKYQEKLENIDFVIYEKNAGVGGTWLENVYPGCGCDLPAHAYTYSWEGNPNWSRFYAEQPEILEYLRSCAAKWNTLQFMKFKHRVVEVRWSEEKSGWDVKIENLEEGTTMHDFCDVLLNCNGLLNNWKWPAIEGLHDFKGKLLHSARWDTEWNYEGQTVAVIGSGSSGIQIVPGLQPVVKHLISFNRSPNWITPEIGQALAKDGKATRFTEEEIKRFNEDKKYFLEYRKNLQNGGAKYFGLYYKGTDLQKDSVKAYTEMMKQRLENNEELCNYLIPKFAVGCKRFTPGEGYLEALIKPNVTVVTSGIEKVTETGLLTSDGRHIEVDAIVCATGFECSYRPLFPVIGRKGRDLNEYWKDEPLHYMSVAAPGFPNYFITGGPNSPVSNGSLISGLENEIDYAYKCITKMQTENILAMDVTEEAMEDFLEHRNAAMERMVWSDGCRSWQVFMYKSGKLNGPVTGPSVGSTWHFNEMLDVPRFEDYKLKYLYKNRFSYLGNGRTERELRGEDIATHLKEPGA